MRNILEADRHLYVILHSRMRFESLDPVFVWLTKAGTKGVVWLGLAAGLFIDGSPHARFAAVTAAAALLLTEFVINVALKPAVRRQRPFVGVVQPRLLVGTPGPHSWPSAHAGSSIAGGAVLAYWYHPWAILFIALAVLIGYSRIYVGVHYPLDVLAGMFVGVICGAVIVGAATALAALHPGWLIVAS